MKAETVLATLIMVVVGIVVVVMASDALALPGSNARPAAAARPQAQPAGEPAAFATRAPLSVTPSADLPEEVRARDARRLSDLEAIAKALQAYKDKKKTYPETGNRVQSACVFQNLDKLCEIKSDVGLEKLQDQRGGNTYGYWYSSDGKTFTIYASMEAASAGGDRCPADASVIKAPNLFCLNSHTAEAADED